MIQFLTRCLSTKFPGCARIQVPVSSDSVPNPSALWAQLLGVPVRGYFTVTKLSSETRQPVVERGLWTESKSRTRLSAFHPIAAARSLPKVPVESPFGCDLGGA
jgi:hypothetical protein